MQFSAAGLRTLALCYRELSEAEVSAFAGGYTRVCVPCACACACAHMHSCALSSQIAAFAAKEQDAIRQLMDKSEIDRLWETVEFGCVCLGCTAIEDKLQEGVPETIQVGGWGLGVGSCWVWGLSCDGLGFMVWGLGFGGAEVLAGAAASQREGVDVDGGQEGDGARHRKDHVPH